MHDEDLWPNTQTTIAGYIRTYAHNTKVQTRPYIYIYIYACLVDLSVCLSCMDAWMDEWICYLYGCVV